MNIVCVICRDLIIPSDDIFYTPCGHLFHYACLHQWLERSKTCPQCREKTTVNKIHRLYFNFSNNDSITEDRCSLQDKIDKLTYDLAMRDKDVKHYLEKSENLAKQAAQLRTEVHKVEQELKTKETALHAYKEQMNYIKMQLQGVEEKDKKLASVQNKLQTYKNIQELLQGSEKEVKEILLSSQDRNSLATYIVALKRELLITMEKRREWRTKMKGMQQELSKVTMERNLLTNEKEKRTKLEEDILIYESRIMQLEGKLRDMEQHGPSEKGSPVNLKPTVLSDNLPCSKCNKPLRVQDVKDYVSDNSSPKDSSPYLPVKSIGIYNLEERLPKRSAVKSSSILTKKPRIEPKQGNIQIVSSVSLLTELSRKLAILNSHFIQRSEINIAYNGLGGHSKLDHFPSSSGVSRKRT